MLERINASIPIATAKPPLEDAIATLDSTLEILSTNLHDLFSRLEPVLAPLPEKPGPAVAPNTCGHSLVVERIQNITSRIELLTDALGYVRRRLEV